MFFVGFGGCGCPGTSIGGGGCQYRIPVETLPFIVTGAFASFLRLSPFLRGGSGKRLSFPTCRTFFCSSNVLASSCCARARFLARHRCCLIRALARFRSSLRCAESVTTFDASCIEKGRADGVAVGTMSKELCFSDILIYRSDGSYLNYCVVAPEHCVSIHSSLLILNRESNMSSKMTLSFVAATAGLRLLVCMLGKQHEK